MPETLYVKPLSEASTCSGCGQTVAPKWGVFDDPDGEPVSGEFDTRGEAKQSALDRRTTEAVVLLRADGSVHSEMRPADLGPEERAEAVMGGIDPDIVLAYAQRLQDDPDAASGQVIQGGTAKENVK